MTGLIAEQMIRRFFRLRLMLPVLIIVAIIILCFFNEQILVHGFEILLFIIIPVSGLLISVQDYGNNWYKYEKILPISGNKIVLSKLLCYMIDVLMAFALGALFCGIAFFIDNSLFDLGLIDTFSILVILLTVVLFIGALFFGGIYFIGVGRAEIWLLMSILISLVATAAVVISLNKSGIGKIPGMLIMLCIAFLALVLSCSIAGKSFGRSKL